MSRIAWLLLSSTLFGCSSGTSDQTAESDTPAPNSPTASPAGGAGAGGTETEPLPVGGGGAGGSAGGAGPTETPTPDKPVETPKPTYDCDKLPAVPLTQTLLEAPRAYHGITFTNDGYLIGSDESGNLLQAPSATEAMLFVPNIGVGKQLVTLASGDIVFSAQDGVLTRITRDGVTSPIATDLFAYGVIIGKDKQLYVIPDIEAPRASLIRIDPESGDQKILLERPLNDDTDAVLHSLAFGVGGRELFIGNIGDDQLRRLKFDAAMNPSSELEEVATLPGSYHDAIGVDACGNVYVSDFGEHKISRVAPSGEVSTIYEAPFEPDDLHAHALTWGNGVGPWRKDALYLALPYAEHKVIELEVGVPAAE